MRIRGLATVTGGLCIALFSVAIKAQSQSHQDFVCYSGSEKRIVRIISLVHSGRLPRGACRVDYSKDGVTKKLWSSATGLAFCTKRATRLVTKLAEAHYSCRLETLEQTDNDEAPR